MPVRFRCQYCNQLLGIARRKIGTEVSCPTCRNKVLVPPTDSADVDQPAPKKDPLFEGSDLDALLRPAAPPSPPPAVQKPTPQTWSPPAPAPAAFNVDPYNPPSLTASGAPPTGVTLSPMQATLCTVGVVLLLAVFFAAGLLIGRFLL